MARIKAWLNDFCAFYPRSVFDLSPIDLGHFASSSDADAVVGDWQNVRDDVRNAAWRVYVGG